MAFEVIDPAGHAAVPGPSAGGRRGVGRPRAGGPSRSGLTPRGDVLAAAAELFTERGYAATTTRAVAEQAGLRQASLYHWFDGKEAILAELLQGTVGPSLDLARELLSQHDRPAEDRLRDLCAADLRLLCGGAHNLGELYLLPEVRRGRFAEFHRIRGELKAAYASLLTAAVREAGRPPAEPETAVRAELLFGLIEGVILIRRQSAPGGRDMEELVGAAVGAALRVGLGN
jgi:AcrR family transcriptional regulator